MITQDIERWLLAAKQGVETNSKEQWPNCELNWQTFTWTVGRKYIKVINERLGHGDNGSVYCFIDEHGNILFPAGWSRPAKGIRGTIYNIVPSKLDGSTGWMYRR